MPYPSINFTTTKRYPVATGRPWRDKIAVVGEFSKGPADVVDVTEDQFELYYGRDQYNGSAVVQQALDLGATNISISRAVPEDTQAVASISLASGNTSVFDPKVGYEVSIGEFNPTINNTDYTIGISLDFRFIGEAFIERTMGSAVFTKDASFDHPGLVENNEQGLIRFTVTNFRAGTDTPEVKHDVAKFLQIKTAAGTAGGYQIASMPKAVVAGTNDIEELKNSILPGYLLKTADFVGDASGTAVTVQVVSVPFSLSSTEYGVLVYNVTDTTAALGNKFQIEDPADDVYVVGYRSVVQQTGELATRTASASYYKHAAGAFVNEYISQNIDGWFLLPANFADEYFEFKYLTVDGNADSSTAYALEQEAFSSDPTEGIQLQFSKAPTSNLIAMLIGGQFIVPFSSAYVTAGSDNASSTLAYNVGVNGKKIIRDLYDAIYSSSTLTSLLQEVDVSTSFFPYTMTFYSAVKGLAANRIRYKVVRHVSAGTPEDIYLAVDTTGYTNTPSPNFQLMSGAFDGPSFGERIFYAVDGMPLVRVMALSPGSQNIKVTLIPQPTIDDQSVDFTLSVDSVYDGRPITEVLSLSTKNVRTESGLFVGSLGSSFVRAFFLPYTEYNFSGASLETTASVASKMPSRNNPPFALYSNSYTDTIYSATNFGANVTKQLPLLGGRDSSVAPPFTRSQIRKAAYLSAVRRLRTSDAAFVVISGISYGDPLFVDVFEEAIRQVNEATAETGLRQLFLETPENLPPAQSASLATSINNRYVTLLNGRITQQLPNNLFSQRVSPLGYYAGLMAVRPPFISVHAPLQGQRLPGILSSNINADAAYKTAISKSRVDSIYYDNGLRSWKFLNGLTTSSEPTDRYVAVNRIRIQIISDLYDYLQWVRSMPNTRSTQRQVQTSISAYMETKLQQGWIIRIGSVICGPSNNSDSDVAQGRLNVEISYVPVVPADYILVNLIEDYTLIDNFSLTTIAS